MNTNTLKAFLIFVVIFGIIAVAAWAFSPFRTGTAKKHSAGGSLALLHVEGMISGSPGGGGLFGGGGFASAIDLCEQLYEIRDDPGIKGVVLRINSPGGAAAASDEIYRAVRAVRGSGKPVVVSMGDTAASGGYYIASAADYIFANGATLTGSIGVVFSMYNWEEAAAKLGIADQTLTAGEFKDIGSPWRDMTPEEATMLTDLMTQVHDQFIVAIAEGRPNLTEEQVREVATGMVYTGEKAVELGLVDELGGLEAAKAKLRDLTGVGASVPVEAYGAGSIWDDIFGAGTPVDPVQAMLGRLGADPLTRLANGMYLNTTLRDLAVR